MLVLSRRIGESVVIGDGIVVKVLAVRGQQVRLGFEAPGNVGIWRQEVAWADVPLRVERAEENAPAESAHAYSK